MERINEDFTNRSLRYITVSEKDDLYQLINCTYTSCGFKGDWGIVQFGGTFDFNIANGGLLSIINTTFKNCYSNKGGAFLLSVSNGGKATLTNTKFLGCYSNRGGAIYVELDLDSELILQNQCQFSDCYSDRQNGGGIEAYMPKGGKVTLSGAIFRNCSAINGGAISVYSVQNCILTIGNGCSFDNCKASNKGGGLYVDLNFNASVQFNIRDAQIGYCSASFLGGGIFLAGDGDYNPSSNGLDFRGLKINYNNTATYGGKTLFVVMSKLKEWCQYGNNGQFVKGNYSDSTSNETDLQGIPINTTQFNKLNLSQIIQKQVYLEQYWNKVEDKVDDQDKEQDKEQEQDQYSDDDDQYYDGDSKSNLPWWAIFLIVIASISLVIILLLLCIYCCYECDCCSSCIKGCCSCLADCCSDYYSGCSNCTQDRRLAQIIPYPQAHPDIPGTPTHFAQIDVIPNQPTSPIPIVVTLDPPTPLLIHDQDEILQQLQHGIVGRSYMKKNQYGGQIINENGQIESTFQDCSICQQIIAVDEDISIITDCLDKYHYECILSWFKQQLKNACNNQVKFSCPNCTQTFDSLREKTLAPYLIQPQHHSSSELQLLQQQQQQIQQQNYSYAPPNQQQSQSQSSTLRRQRVGDENYVVLMRSYPNENQL